MELMPQHLFDDPTAKSGFDILELFGRKNLENIMQKIAAATGLAFVTVDYRGEPVTDSISFCSFCKRVQEDPERAKLCSASNAFGAIQAAVFRNTNVYFCPCGLLEVAIPLEVQGQFLGGFIGGQINCQDAPPDVVHLSSVLHHSRDWSKEFQEDFEHVLQLPYEKFLHITELISLVVQQLGEKELINVIQRKHHDDQIALYIEREQRMELEKGLNESKLVELRSLMSPYFLSSTLTAISNIAAIENARQSNEVITVFARFLLESTNRKNPSELLADEMKMVDHYLFVQKRCMGERLSYRIQMANGMELQQVPNMLVFPLVERAVYYGIVCKSGEGRIDVTADYDQDHVVICVADDGPGLNDSELQAFFAHRTEEEQTEIIAKGIDIVNQRLEKHFGPEYRVQIEVKRGKGTTCTVRYPRSFDGRKP